MIDDIVKNGSTSNVLRLKLRNASTGAGLTGLAYNSSGLKIATLACPNESASTSYTAGGNTIETVSGGLGTYQTPTASKCRFIEIDSTNHPGVYELHLADARFAVSGARELRISVTGATNLLDQEIRVQLTAANLDDTVRLGLTSLPNVASGSAGALITSGTGTAQLATTGGRITSYHAKHVAKSGTVTYYTAASDTDASRGTSLVSAQTAASDGTIYVEPGTYLITTPLGKNGVNWHFAQGATVTAADLEVWRDYDGGGTPSAMVFSVTGYGKFIGTGTGTYPVIAFYHANSVITMEGLLAHQQSTGNAICITPGDGRHAFKFSRIRSDRYDAILYAGGRAHFEADFIEGGDNAIELGDALLGATLEQLTVICHNTMDGGFNSALPSSTIADTVGTCKSCVIKAGRIKAPPTTGVAVAFDMVGGAGTTYLECPCIEGQVSYADGYHVLANSLINSSAFAKPSLKIAANNVVLENVTCITKSTETDSIYAASAKSLSAMGGLAYNKAVNANVTINQVDGIDWQRLSNKTATVGLTGTSTKALEPTVAGRTLDVTSTGEAGIDWANVGSPTTSVNLSGTSTKAIEPTTAGRTLDVSATGTAGIDWSNIDNKTSTAALTNTTVSGGGGGGGSSGPVEHTPIPASRILTVRSRGDGQYDVIGSIRMVAGETLWWAVDLKGTQLAIGQLVDAMAAPTAGGTESANLTISSYGLLGTLAKFLCVLSGSATTSDNITVELSISPNSTETLLISVPLKVIA